MLRRALDALIDAGVAQDAITVMPVPGAFELPLAAMALAKTRRYACIVALGAIVRGETPHFDYVAAESASGLQLAGDRDRRPRRVRRAHGRHRRAGGGPDRQGRRRGAVGARDGRRLRTAARQRAGLAARSLHFRRSMCKICAICGKKPAFGNHRSHSMVATKRRFDPNLQRVRVLLNGSPQRAYVCTRCLKGGKVTKAV